MIWGIPLPLGSQCSRPLVRTDSCIHRSVQVRRDIIDVGIEDRSQFGRDLHHGIEQRFAGSRTTARGRTA